MWLLVLRLLFFFETGSETESSACINKASIKDWSCDGLCAATAASFANNMSLIIACFTFVFAFRREGLNSFPSVRVCRYIPSSAVPKSCLRSSEKKILKIVGANTQHYLTPLRILKGLDTLTGVIIIKKKQCIFKITQWFFK